MNTLLEKMTFDDLKYFMKKHGRDIAFDELDGGPARGGHYLIRFAHQGINCFVYYEFADRKSNRTEITELYLDAFFDHDDVIRPEDVNEINAGDLGMPI